MREEWRLYTRTANRHVRSRCDVRARNNCAIYEQRNGMLGVADATSMYGTAVRGAARHSWLPDPLPEEQLDRAGYLTLV